MRRARRSFVFPPRRSPRRIRAGLALRLALGAMALAMPAASVHHAAAQLTGQAPPRSLPPSDDRPVTFVADSVQYDRERGLVIATGNVEAWQDDRVLRAQRIVFDRNTSVAAASGNVVLMEPDGRVVFAEYAELGQGMKDGVLRGMRALLAENGRLAANGARRTDGKVNELARVVYSACDLCKDDPTRPPLWQLRAQTAVQDLEHKRIEYFDGVLDMWGIPVAYVPWFSHSDPSVKRASGFLIPSLGASTHLGFFGTLPYYWAIDDQTDATFTPMFTTKAGQQFGLEVRRRFNFGEFELNGAINEYAGRIEGAVQSKARVNLDETWRAGFDIARASSAEYVRNFGLGRFAGGSSGVLPSQIFLEGFGQGAYLRLEGRLYQSVTAGTVNARLPAVLPRLQYSYFGAVDPLGGRLSVDADAFNIRRQNGADTRRGALGLQWDRPFSGLVGDQWKFTVRADIAAYDANDTQLQPYYLTPDKVTRARAHPQAALEVRWPFLRDAGAWGSQVIEPIAQVIVGPRIGRWQFRWLPNEDSLDLQFTDANLFALNRYSGIDRMEGGSRVNLGLRGAWFLGGTTFEGLIGQSYRFDGERLFPAGSGLNERVSDIVGRVSVAPTDWFDVTYRTRLDKRRLTTRFADVTATLGKPVFKVSVGYVYSSTNPYALYTNSPYPPGPDFFTPRNEVTVGVSSRLGPFRLSGFARRDLHTGEMVAVGASGAYEDECSIFDVRYQQRFTSINGDRGAKAILFQVTLKTVGAFGFRAM
jgi:LPS-assembly protein